VPVTIPAGRSEPAAIIERSGRGWRITIEHRLLEIGPGVSGVILGWHRWTRSGAKRKARRELERYRREETPPERFEIV
jgi:hypothetical protein